MVASFALVSLSCMVTKEVFAVNQKGTVQGAYMLNVRESASSKAKIKAVLHKGDTVDVLNQGKSWDYIQFQDVKGYVYDSYLNVSTTPSNNDSTANQGKVTSYRLTVRSGPSTSYKDIDYLKQGAVVSIVSKTGNWYKVQYGTRTGYVSTSYIQLTSDAPSEPSQPSSPTPTDTYKVQSGDTLFSVATSHQLTVDQLKALNGLTSNLIKTNQVLKVEGTVTTPVPPTPTPVTPPTQGSSKTLVGKVVVLDPGHGNNRPGAVGNGIVEKTLNYDVSMRTKAILESKGAKVVMTRIGDTDCTPGSLSSDLVCRAQVANKLNASAFVSVHTNSGSSAANGAETFYYNSNSIGLATSVQNDYVQATGLHYRRVAYGNLAVLRSNKVPATLVELGFLSNPSDATKLKNNEFKTKAATGIANGIEHYLAK